MNKILFLLGMVFCLDASARVALVAENNNYIVTEDHSAATNEAPLEYAEVIDVQQRYRTFATRGVCRPLDNSGRQVCEPGRVISKDFVGFDVTYQYKNFVGTILLPEIPTGGRILMKTAITPIIK
jgi:uncharacterized protein YcfJ